MEPQHQVAHELPLFEIRRQSLFISWCRSGWMENKTILISPPSQSPNTNVSFMLLVPDINNGCLKSVTWVPKVSNIVNNTVLVNLVTRQSLSKCGAATPQPTVSVRYYHSSLSVPCRGSNAPTPFNYIVSCKQEHGH